MSRIGKKPIPIPEGVEVKIAGQKVSIKGPKGELSREIRPEIKVRTAEDRVWFSPQQEKKETSAFWGLERTLINNMIEGVSRGFEKKLEIRGVGYRAWLEGNVLLLEVGFSHEVRLEIPKGLEVSSEGNVIAVKGIDKRLVGQFAANIRRVKKPDAYKGKGIRYLGEEIKLKPGKKAAAVA